MCHEIIERRFRSISMIRRAVMEHHCSMILRGVSMSSRRSLWPVVLSAACMRGSILIWRETPQTWNTPSYSSCPSIDFAMHANSKFWMEKSKNNQLSLPVAKKILSKPGVRAARLPCTDSETFFECSNRWGKGQKHINSEILDHFKPGTCTKVTNS